MTDLVALLERDLADAERKAWDAVARWKFWMFGYWAANVVKTKRLLGRGREPFFKVLVDAARQHMRENTASRSDRRRTTMHRGRRQREDFARALDTSSCRPRRSRRLRTMAEMARLGVAWRDRLRLEQGRALSRLERR